MRPPPDTPRRRPAPVDVGLCAHSRRFIRAASRRRSTGPIVADVRRARRRQAPRIIGAPVERPRHFAHRPCVDPDQQSRRLPGRRTWAAACEELLGRENARFETSCGPFYPEASQKPCISSHRLPGRTAASAQPSPFLSAPAPLQSTTCFRATSRNRSASASPAAQPPRSTSHGPACRSTAGTRVVGRNLIGLGRPRKVGYRPAKRRRLRH